MISMVGHAYHSTAQVSGNIFLDTNGDGKLSVQSKTEKGLSGIRIIAKNNKDEQVAATTSDSYGNYFLDIPTNQRIKVVFEGLDKTQYPTQKGLVRFVNSPAKDVSLGLYNPTKYSTDKPNIVIPTYINGNPIGRKKGEDLPALLISKYLVEKDSLIMDTLAYSATVGAVWGVAYAGLDNKIYTSALLKRHAGFGELGISGIYQINPETKKVTPFIALDQLGINCGKVERNDLLIDLDSKSIEKSVYSLIGKAGLGGLDVSDDGSTLYVMNLYDKRLYAFSTNNPKAQFKSYSLPISNNSAGEMRPFAVKFYEGKVYVGVINDANKSQKNTDLQAIVYALNPVNQQLDEILKMPLDYKRGKAVNGSEVRGWFPWSDDFSKAILPENPSTAIYPQPILSDIEFDEDGSMILGFMDRFGHQTGDGQPDPEGQHLYTGIAAGDILKVYRKRATKYELEANAEVGKITSEGMNNAQGPKGGEFFHQEYFAPEGREIIHEENGAGGLAYLRGTDEVLNSVHEPSNEYNTGGIKWLDNKKGTAKNGLSVFYDRQVGTFSKSNNVGDLELITGQPTIEIGNRVWMDCDEDGIQDADEKPLANISVELFEGSKFIGGTSTDANGEYYFNAQNCSESLKPNTDYLVKIPLLQAGNRQLTLTKSNIGNDEFDNDGVKENDFALVKFKTQTLGSRVYQYDFGFQCTNKPSSELQIICSTINGSTEVSVSLKNKQVSQEHFDLQKANTITQLSEYEHAKAIPANKIILNEKILSDGMPQNYSVRVISSENCFKDYEFTLSEKGCLNLDLNENLIIFPNPVVENKLKFAYKSIFESTEISISVIDAVGKEITQKSITGKNGQFTDTIGLENTIEGSYLLRVIDNAKVISKHFTKL